MCDADDSIAHVIGSTKFRVRLVECTRQITSETALASSDPLNGLQLYSAYRRQDLKPLSFLCKWTGMPSLEETIQSLKLENKALRDENLRMAQGRKFVAEGFTRALIERYSRHLLMPQVGLEGQRKLLSCSVCIVGCGGLGSSAALYLAAAGFGRIGVVDFDEVELSNLQRQVIHSEKRVGHSKAHSAAASIAELNSAVKVDVHHTLLSSLNVSDVLKPYDIVLDCTDNVSTRYLLNDACVLLSKPLVSGSALLLHGQLSVYWPPNGPCYRCLFPKPPPPESVTNCSDGGVLGAVPGLLGVLQAIEAIKIAINRPLSEIFVRRLLLFDAFSEQLSPFRVVRLRGQVSGCAACSGQLTEEKLRGTNYSQLCGSGPKDEALSLDLLDDSEHLTCLQLHEHITLQRDFVLLDVRERQQAMICGLLAISIPLEELSSSENIGRLEATAGPCGMDHKPIYVLCRRGNDSQIAVKLLRDKGFQGTVLNLKGGLEEWSKSIDPSFPLY